MRSARLTPAVCDMSVFFRGGQAEGAAQDWSVENHASDRSGGLIPGLEG